MGSPHRTSAYRQLRADAVDCHGVVTLDQLHALGIRSSTVGDWRRSGRLCRLARGVYAVPELLDRWSRLSAQCRSTPGAVASHRAAARLWALDGIDVDVVELTVPRQARRAAGLVHRSEDLADVDMAEVEAIPCTDATRTLVDLGAVVALDVVERALESALRQRLTTVPRLQWRLSCLARRGRRGPSALQAVLRRRALGAPPTDSELEIRFLQCLRAAGVEQPVRQHAVRLPGGRVVRLDDAYPEAKLFIELDGWMAHRSKQAFGHDRRRQNEVVLLGWQPLRFTWADVVGDPDRVAGEVATMLRRPGGWMASG